MLGLAGAVLAVGAVVLVLWRDLGDIDLLYLLLLVGGTAGVSFTVGYVAGLVSEGTFASPPGEGD